MSKRACHVLVKLDSVIVEPSLKRLSSDKELGVTASHNGKHTCLQNSSGLRVAVIEFTYGSSLFTTRNIS